jgi:Holliday junction resolvase RusA-like endonuclease
MRADLAKELCFLENHCCPNLMSELISFFVPGEAAAQGRPRTRVLRLGKRSVAQIYNPHNADEWKARVQIIARPFIPRTPMLGPIRIAVTFLLRRPQSHYIRKGAGVKPGAPLWHVCKPDADNFIKAVKDALTAVKMWGDDSQVCDERTRKIYQPEADDVPGCFITIQQITTSPEIPELCPIFEHPKKDPTAPSRKRSKSISTSPQP